MWLSHLPEAAQPLHGDLNPGLLNSEAQVPDHDACCLELWIIPRPPRRPTEQAFPKKNVGFQTQQIQRLAERTQNAASQAPSGRDSDSASLHGAQVPSDKTPRVFVILGLCGAVDLRDGLEVAVGGRGEGCWLHFFLI